jgi:hypothetical protein
MSEYILPWKKNESEIWAVMVFSPPFMEPGFIRNNHALSIPSRQGDLLPVGPIIEVCFVRYGQNLAIFFITMAIFEKPSRFAQAGRKKGSKFRFLHIGDHQPVFGPVTTT